MKIGRNLDIIVLALIWAVFYISGKGALNAVPVYLYGFLVRCIVFVGLSLFMLKKGSLKTLFKHGKITYRMVIVGLIGFSLDYAAFLGLRLSSAMNASVLLKSDMLFVNVMTIVLLREKIGKKGWAGSAIILLGALLVMGVNPIQLRFTGIGDLLLVLSAFFLALNAFVIRSIQRHAGVENEHISWFANFVILVIFGTLSLIEGSLQQLFMNPLGADSFFWVILAGITQLMVYVLYYQALRSHPIWIVKTLLLSTPVFAAILAMLFLGEKPHIGLLLGMPLVLGGAWLIIQVQAQRQGEISLIESSKTVQSLMTTRKDI